MILDHKFHGILDQGKGQLIVYDNPVEDVSVVVIFHSMKLILVVSRQKTYTAGLGVIKNVGVIVDSLYRLSENLHA